MPDAALPSFNTLIQSSWNRFWRLAGKLVLIYALAEAVTLGVYYLTGGWASVRLNLGLPADLATPFSDFNFTRSEIIQLSLELLGLGLVNTIVFGLAAVNLNENLGLRATLRRFGFRLPSLIIVSLAVGLAVLIGAIFFIIPGVIASVWFLFAGFIAVVENQPPGRALKLSQRLAGPIFWPLFGRWLAIVLVIGVLGFLVLNVPVAGALANSLLLGPFSTVFMYELYLASRKILPASHD